MSDFVINDIMTDFIEFPFEPVVNFKNTVVESYAGLQQVFSNVEHDRMEYALNFSALTLAEAKIIFNFFRARQGSYDDFLFLDPDYNFVPRVSIGTGDGAETAFQLKDAEGHERWDLQETPIDAKIWVNNVLQTKTTHYSIDYTKSGIVTFTFIPTVGHNIEAEFYFWRRMRFLSDSSGYNHVSYNNLAYQNLRMLEVLVP
jgi:uncharacterized protein (TIGR02217 family)